MGLATESGLAVPIGYCQVGGSANEGWIAEGEALVPHPPVDVILPEIKAAPHPFNLPLTSDRPPKSHESLCIASCVF